MRQENRKEPFTRQQSCFAVPVGSDAPARVAFVTTALGIGGAERLLVELITRLDRSRFAPTLVCLKDRSVLGEGLADRGVPVVDRVSRGRLDVSVMHRLATIFREADTQVVCTVGTGGDRSFWGRLAARWAGVPVILSCPHSMGQPDRFEPSNRLLSGITDGFIAVAQRQKRYLARCEGFSASKIHVIYNGVDLARFAPESDRSIRATIGVPAEAPLAGVVACLRPEKDLGTFLRAADRVLCTTPDAHFVVVGDGPERSKLEQLARDLGIGSRVHFAGMCSDVRPWLHSMDVLALSSVCEAFPLSLLEAMACAKPVVATRVGAIPEMVRHGVTGLLAARENPEDLAAAIGRLFADRYLAREMGRKGRERVEKHFDLNGMVRGYESLFGRLLHRKERGHWASVH
jgi:glycosyltransferase involved in cell wall biosynthesis